MAGHTRSADTGTARRTSSGKSRRVRKHLPAGEAAAARRTKQQQGARTLTDHKIRRERDPLRQLDIARDYVRSAANKYHPGGQVADAIAALLAAGDRIYESGTPNTRR